MNTDTDALARERERLDAWHREHDAIAARLLLSPNAARMLAFRLVTELLTQLVGAPLGALFASRMADVVALVAAMGHRLGIVASGPFDDLYDVADKLHTRLFVLVGPRGTWPDQLRLPADAAEAVRRACEPDPIAALPRLYIGARAVLERARMRPEALDELFAEAHREAVEGLDALVREAAAVPKEDVVLQALHVGCGAQAVEAVRAPPRSRWVGDPPDPTPSGCDGGHPGCTVCDSLAAAPHVVGTIDGEPVFVRGGDR